MMVKKKDDSWRIYVAYLLSLSQMTLIMWPSELECLGGRRTSRTHGHYLDNGKSKGATWKSYATLTSKPPFFFPLEDKLEFRAGGDDTIYLRRNKPDYG